MKNTITFEEASFMSSLCLEIDTENIMLGSKTYEEIGQLRAFEFQNYLKTYMLGLKLSVEFSKGRMKKQYIESIKAKGVYHP